MKKNEEQKILKACDSRLQKIRTKSFGMLKNSDKKYKEK